MIALVIYALENCVCVRAADTDNLVDTRAQQVYKRVRVRVIYGKVCAKQTKTFLRKNWARRRRKKKFFFFSLAALEIRVCATLKFGPLLLPVCVCVCRPLEPH